MALSKIRKISTFSQLKDSSSTAHNKSQQVIKTDTIIRAEHGAQQSSDKLAFKRGKCKCRIDSRAANH